MSWATAPRVLYVTALSKWKCRVEMSSTDEEEESERGDEHSCLISSWASIMSTVTEVVSGRGAKELGREDSGIPGDACLLSPNSEALVFFPSPNDIATSAMLGERETKRGGEGEAARPA